MQLILLVFVIGVLNLCLGFAASVYLRNGEQESRSFQNLPPNEPPRDEVAQSVSDQPPPQTVVATTSQAKSPADEPTPSPTGCLQALQTTVDAAGDRLAELIVRLKRGDKSRSVWSFVGELQDICNAYLRTLTNVADQFLDAAGTDEKVLDDELQDIVLEQTAQLETTLSNLQHMNFEIGESEALTRLKTEASNTLTSARRLQELLQATLSPSPNDEPLPISQ